VDFDRHTIFCYECNDYVYDVEINEKITKAEIVSSSKEKKIDGLNRLNPFLSLLRIKKKKAAGAICSMGAQ
jgi:hypothetical protein